MYGDGHKGTRGEREGVSVVGVRRVVIWEGGWAVEVGDCGCSGGNRVGEFDWD